MNLTANRTTRRSRRIGKTLVGIVGAGIVSLGVMNPAYASTLTHTVVQGESLWSIAQANHVTVAALEAANRNVQATNLLVGTILQMPTTTGLNTETTKSYTVQPGDTFWLLSRRFNVDLAHLMALNPTIHAAYLLPGMTLSVPLATSASQASQPLQATLSSSSKGSTSSSTINPQDLYWMAHVIYAEAGGESLQAQIAVGDVVLHRVQSPNYPNTVQGVVFQQISGHYQFSCVPNGFIYSQPSPTSYQAATTVLSQHVDVVPGAFVFYAPALTPAGSWVWQQPKLATIGPFIFAK